MKTATPAHRAGAPRRERRDRAVRSAGCAAVNGEDWHQACGRRTPRADRVTRLAPASAPGWR